MMKKLAKATLLAAAAFLLAGFPACSSDDDDPTLDKIEIKVDESTVKTTYSVGEDFDPAGITVTATYSDGSTEDVTAATEFKATYNDEDFTTATAGTYEGVILTATYGGKTDFVTCTITVKASSTTDPTTPGNPTDPTLTGIKITVDESKVKTTYTVGEDFDPVGITVTATYSNDTTEDVTDDAEFKVTCDGKVFTTETAGNFEVTLTATYGGKTDSVTCPIEVKAGGITGDEGGNGEGGNTGAPIDLTYSFKDFSNAAFSGTSSITLTSDVTLDTDTDGVKIVLLAAGSEVFGASEIAANTESNGVTLTSKYKLKNDPAYKVNNSGTGLTIKNTCIKITGVTGDVDVVIDWCIASKNLNDNDRGIFVKVGDTIKGQGCAATPETVDGEAEDTKHDAKSYKNKLEASGTASGDIYIAASNESIIENITITSK